MSIGHYTLRLLLPWPNESPLRRAKDVCAIVRLPPKVPLRESFTCYTGVDVALGVDAAHRPRPFGDKSRTIFSWSPGTGNLSCRKKPRVDRKQKTRNSITQQIWHLTNRKKEKMSLIIKKS